MKMHPSMLPILILALFTCSVGIEYFAQGTEFSWQASARLWLANGNTIEGRFTVSDPWLVVLPQTQSHTMPFFWQDISSIELRSGSNAIIHKADGSVVKTGFVYGILSGERLYFYDDENSVTYNIYVMVFNEREKPTPEFMHVCKVEFLETPKVTDPVVFSTYR